MKISFIFKVAQINKDSLKELRAVSPSLSERWRAGREGRTPTVLPLLIPVDMSPFILAQDPFYIPNSSFCLGMVENHGQSYVNVPGMGRKLKIVSQHWSLKETEVGS